MDLECHARPSQLTAKVRIMTFTVCRPVSVSRLKNVLFFHELGKVLRSKYRTENFF